MRPFNSQSIPRPNLAHPNLPSRFDLEIGAGQGLHAIQYAQCNPRRALVAVERTQGRFTALKSRALKHNLPNLMPVRADAIPFVTHFVADQTLERIFLLYPNPYPKPAQANQRWHRSSFMQFLKTKLRPRGTLTLATNLSWYAEEAAEWMCAKHAFTLLSFQHVETSRPGRTHFERKYTARGETCFDLVFETGLQ